MKHAQENILNKFNNQIDKLRQLEKLTEKKKGIFYKKSSAFLHFHQDNNILFADLKISNNWLRFRTEENQEWNILLEEVNKLL